MATLVNFYNTCWMAACRREARAYSRATQSVRRIQEELLARLRAIIRRSAGQANGVLQVGPLSLDPRAMRVTRDGAPLNLSPQEYRLIAYMMHHAGRVVTQIELTEHLYAQDFERDSNAIEVLVGRVRKKLGPEVIETRRGFGYVMGGAAVGQ